MKSARRRSREFAVQALYSWLLTNNDLDGVQSQFDGAKGFDRIDLPFFMFLVRGVILDRDGLEQALAPFLSRAPKSLSPVEHAILLVASHELRNTPETPSRIVINEAIELAKSYGGSDGHKFVNGVLDKLARFLRPGEYGE